MIQSTGVIPTLSDERQIDVAVAEWAKRDRCELMNDCLQEDIGVQQLTTKAMNAHQSGDQETADRLFSEFNERRRQYAIERMRDAILEVRCPPTETGSNGDKTKRKGGTRSDLYFSSSPS